MDLKGFFRPKKEKIIIFISLIVFIFLFELMMKGLRVSCGPEFSCKQPLSAEIISGILYFLTLAGHSILTILQSRIHSSFVAYSLIIIAQSIYFYLLSSVIVLIITFIRKK